VESREKLPWILWLSSDEVRAPQPVGLSHFLSKISFSFRLVDVDSRRGLFDLADFLGNGLEMARYLTNRLSIL
jgi:hypothetical protein